MRLLKFISLAAAILIFPASALAESYTATVVKPEKKADDKTPSLVTFPNTSVEVKQGTLNGAPVLYASMDGKFAAPEFETQSWSLISDKKVLRMNAEGAFHFSLVLVGKVTRVDFVAVSPKGEVLRDQAGVIFDRFDEITTGRKVEKKEQANFTVGLGVATLDYRDDTRSGISQTTLIGKIAVDQPIGRNTPWSLGVNFYSTFAELSKSTTSSTEVFGTNVRLGYRLLQSGRWTIRAFLGLYYTTTYGGSDDFGYSNLFGPQLYPTFSYVQRNGAVTTIALKYSPVSNGFTFYSTDNREFAVGATYFFAPFTGGWLRDKSLGLTADLAWLSLKSSVLGSSKFNSMSFGTALRF